jgi:transcriptional regulator with XRE-family HTH domain
MAWTGLGERLKRAREQRGLPGPTVADQLGCDVRTLYRWERDEFEPSIGSLARLAELYGVTVNHLIHGDNNGNAA